MGGQIGGVARDSPGAVGDRCEGSRVRHVGLKQERARWAGEEGIQKTGRCVSTWRASFPPFPAAVAGGLRVFVAQDLGAGPACGELLAFVLLPTEMLLA